MGVHRIVITDPLKLREAIHFAHQNSCVDELGRGVLRLLHLLTSSMVEEGEKPAERSVTAEMGYDFAPLSFSFLITYGELDWHRPQDRNAYGLVGGFIYHGPTSPGDGSGPAFSVDLGWVTGQSPKHSWSIHT